MKYHQTLNERKMVVFVVQTSRYFGPCRILPYPAVSCRILPYLPYPAVSCRILPYPAYPAVSCRILPYPAVSCRILPYPAVSCRILPYHAVSCRILPYRIRVTGKPHCMSCIDAGLPPPHYTELTHRLSIVFHIQVQKQSRLRRTFRNFSNTHCMSMTCLLLRFRAPCQQALLRGPSL